MSEEIIATETLDVKGLRCPKPILKLGKYARKAEKGTIIKVVATDPGTIADIPAWAKRAGAEVLKVDEGKDEIKFYVRIK
ncbi:MAG: sulfurtransferase TusA family protein [Candidatus Hodarchaeales archaeon]|jgi:tRNA 2-thiouridine synthesizing protein A